MLKLKNTWDNFIKTFSSCRKCPLHIGAKQKIFGKGPKFSMFLLIGDAPGKEEDNSITAEPFVGRAGRKLDELFKEGGVDISEWYITNSCICRPPNNRPPESKEKIACFQRLKMEIELVKPALIIFCGKAARELPGLGEDMHNFFLGYRRGFLYHPSYILRNASKKEIFMEQLEIVKGRMEEVRKETIPF